MESIKPDRNIVCSTINGFLSIFTDLKCEYIKTSIADVCVITRKSHHFAPAINGLPKCEDLLIYLNPVRLVISLVSLTASLQVLEREIDHICPIITLEQNIWKTPEKLYFLFSQVSETGSYEICEGLSALEAQLDEEAIKDGDHPYKALRIMKRPGFFLIASKQCSGLIHMPKVYPQNKPKSEKCKFCRQCMYNYKCKKNKSIKKDLLPSTSARSYCGLSKLTPNEIRERFQNLRAEKRALQKSKVALEWKISKLRGDKNTNGNTNIPDELPDEMSEDMEDRIEFDNLMQEDELNQTEEELQNGEEIFPNLQPYGDELKENEIRIKDEPDEVQIKVEPLEQDEDEQQIGKERDKLPGPGLDIKKEGDEQRNETCISASQDQRNSKSPQIGQFLT